MKCPRCGELVHDTSEEYALELCDRCADDDVDQDDDGPCSHLYNGDRCELCDAEHPQSLRDFIEENT